MSEAIALLDHGALHRGAAALRQTGEMAIRMSAGKQGIPVEDWTEFRRDRWARERNTAAWKQWRTAVFERDGYRCVECNSRGSRPHGLSPHHIWPKSRFPERCYDVSNGVTLCEPCHVGTFRREMELIEHFEEIVAAREVVLVDPRGTSQECSECGAVVKKPLSERIHRCACGYVADRDTNAARNILARAIGRDAAVRRERWGEEARAVA